MSKKDIRLFVIVLIVSGAAAIFSYQPIWQKISSFRPWSLGLDIAGGTSLIYEVETGKIPAEDRNVVLNGLRDVLERRVNLFGVSEPKVLVVKNETNPRLIIELAGIKNVQKAIQTIGETPFLDFREVVPKPGVITVSTTNDIQFIPTPLNGRYIKKAALNFDNVSQKPTVNIEFTPAGSKLFAEITERNVGKPLAIFLDNQPIEMPVVREKITGGRAEISGNFTLETAKQLVGRFNAGALPAPITLINQYTISPELGADSLRKAIIAGALGTLLVMIFMIIYYKELGIFASIALILYIPLTLGIFKIIPITLTLAGIAGFILSIGMAVDANILVCERTKEETKRGVKPEVAVEEWFKRAWTSIRDSNVSTMITSLVLYYFTSSFVKGFALALFIGVIVSMFSAITLTRTMLRLFIKKSN